MTGYIDINANHRAYHNECKYWNKVQTIDKNQLHFEKEPSGIFYAKETSVYAMDNQNIDEAFLMDSNIVTLKTEDVITLKQKDKVEYQGTKWNVLGVQKKKVRRRSQFIDKYITYIRIKGGEYE